MSDGVAARVFAQCGRSMGLAVTVGRICRYSEIGERVMFSWPEGRWYQGVVDRQYPHINATGVFVEELGYIVGIPQWDLYRPRRHD